MLNLRLKLWKVLGSPVVHVSVKKNSLLVNVLKFCGILAGWYGSAVVRERDRDTKAPGSSLLPCDFLSFLKKHSQ